MNLKPISVVILTAAAAMAQVPAPAPVAPPAAPAPPAISAPDPYRGLTPGRGAFTLYAGKAGEEGIYQNGQNALDNHRWEQAVTSFTDVASRGGTHADGALYWKAYALNKLGKRDEAQAAIADLRKGFPKSRWLEVAQALELEVKQAAGKPVAPEDQSDEELKLLALNGLMHSEPDRALPLIENLLKGTQSPKLKKNAVYVIAQNNSPRAQQLLEQIARGSGNPDLQTLAIRYYAQQKRDQPNAGQMLVSLYSSEQEPQVKQAVLEALRSQQNAKGLVAIARAEKDPEMKKRIVQTLTNMKSPDATDYLLELLK